MYKYFNILSLDVVFGAVVCSLFAGDAIGVNVPVPSLIVLGLCVWVIYTFDHLNDARSIPHDASTERHRFHQVHFKAIALANILAILIITLLLFLMPMNTIFWGIILSAFVVCYFMFLYLLKLKASYHKEMSIAVIYSAGVILPSVSISSNPPLLTVAIFFIQMMMLAFTNLLIFSVYECKSDERDSSPSIVRVLGVERSRWVLKILTVIQLTFGAVLILSEFNVIWELILMMMVLVTASLVIFERFYQRNLWYRYIGDGVFIIPLPYLILL